MTIDGVGSSFNIAFAASRNLAAEGGDGAFQEFDSVDDANEAAAAVPGSQVFANSEGKAIVVPPDADLDYNDDGTLRTVNGVLVPEGYRLVEQATGTTEPEPQATGTTEPEPQATGTTEPEPQATGTTEPEPQATGTTEPEPQEATRTTEPDPM